MALGTPYRFGEGHTRLYMGPRRPSTSNIAVHDQLPPFAVEMIGEEREDGVVVGLVIGLIAGDEHGEVFAGGEPGHGHPHRVAAGVPERGAAGPGLVVGDDPAHGVRWL